MKFEIDTTNLNKEKRGELVQLLYECECSIKPDKRKDGSKIRHIIVCEQG